MTFSYLLLIATDDNLKICDPWQARNFSSFLELTPDGHCDYCLPDCISTIYNTQVSSAPFKPCDHRWSTFCLRFLAISGSIGPQSSLKLLTAFSYLISITMHGPDVICSIIPLNSGRTPLYTSKNSSAVQSPAAIF